MQCWAGRRLRRTAITVGRLFLARKHGTIRVGQPLVVTLNGGTRTPLKRLGPEQLFVDIAFRLQIEPTSLVSIQQFVRVAIQDLGISIRPGLNRDTVLSQLDDSIGGI